LLGQEHNFYGVSSPRLWSVFKSICPDPNLLFKIPELAKKQRISKSEILESRKNQLGKSLSLSYSEPIEFVRGQKQYLIDESGQKYLDTVNNVAHVGHEHPLILHNAIQQMSLLNTNTRYLNKQLVLYANKLLEFFPKELCVVHFVNSGSEANELALRMAEAYTNQKDIIALEVGYHGNTQSVIDVSSYKFDGKGGKGCPELTHIVPLPDSFRGIYRGEGTGLMYASHIEKVIKSVDIEGRGIAAFIHESIVSCGGQIDLPVDYLRFAYEYVRAAGGVCIADEVQVGFGRVGTKFWGFELHGVVPDIVTLGKPIGNGHPLGAVVCTRAVADAFANGMEFFNTFGGNPVSAVVGSSVLDIIEDEKLQENAREIGEYLKAKLNQLKSKYNVIGDVRGVGFFLGIEFTDRDFTPLSQLVSYVSERMKEHLILMSIDGPDHNVLKIKPPMCFNKENADLLVSTLDKVLNEVS
jgi:4-aminobutyrate aminotransferase-like enzyme